MRIDSTYGRSVEGAWNWVSVKYYVCPLCATLWVEAGWGIDRCKK